MSQHWRWNPWQYLRDHHPSVDVTLVDLAPLGLRGRVTPHGVQIDRTCDQRGRRSTLTHEVVHLERGPVPDHPHLALREERTVETITARRMIRLSDLVDAILWCQGRTDDEAAEELWVDHDILEARIRALTPRERGWVERQIARRTS